MGSLAVLEEALEPVAVRESGDEVNEGPAGFKLGSAPIPASIYKGSLVDTWG
jgi:hypothetical protein